MNSYPALFARLSLLVQRLLDAEVLLDADSAPLVGATEAARRSLEAGDAQAARRHVEQVARSTEALVRSEALAAADGRALGRDRLAGHEDVSGERRLRRARRTKDFPFPEE